MNEKNIQAWIFVRGDSLGLPGKNLRPLLGKPLIAYTVEAARKSRFIKDVFVSTDSPTVAATAEQFGAIVPFLRPAELSVFGSPVRNAWVHAIEWNRQQSEFPKMDIMVALPVTTPLRTPSEIDQAIELYLQGECDTVTAVVRSNQHPARNMVYLDGNGYASLCQDKEEERPAYDISSLIRVSGTDYILREQDYLKGRVKTVEVPREHGLDIKTIWDFKLAEIILSEGEAK
ncbi:MAG: acylneuraminate cytidylyltransferase family protein [Lentisphaeria bacterium]|nr:acylneuraminate cytidylyltransferase family protein [Lentisphaeria bacterium]